MVRIKLVNNNIYRKKGCSIMIQISKGLFNYAKKIIVKRKGKKCGELNFWKKEILNYVGWYQEKMSLYGFPPPQ